MVIDWKGEYVDFLKGATVVRKINVWDVPGDSAEEKAVIATELLREVTRDLFDVSGASATLLLRELIKIYQKGIPTTKEVIERLELAAATFARQRRLAEYNMIEALLRRLLWLEIEERRPARNISGSDQVIIYDLRGLSVYLKTLYALIALNRVYRDSVKEGPRRGLKAILVAEEAQNYIRARRLEEPPTMGERLVNELRSYGLGVLMISPDPTQVPAHLPRDVAAVIAIGYQGLPRFVIEHRYEDLEKLSKRAKETRTYIYYDGRLMIRGRPRARNAVLKLTTS